MTAEFLVCIHSPLVFFTGVISVTGNRLGTMRSGITCGKLFFGLAQGSVGWAVNVHKEKIMTNKRVFIAYVYDPGDNAEE